MEGIFRVPSAVKQHPYVTDWFGHHRDELSSIARHWFDVIRSCGDDVNELMHDGYPIACVGDAAFA